MVGIVQAYVTLLHDGAVQPAALVMPDPNGSPRISLQCLNVVHGPQDATYLARDVPGYLSRTLRLQPSGRAWGIAGYSEGGFCAANLALLYPGRYGFAGVLSGYFRPSKDRLGPSRLVNPFGNDTKLRQANTPLDRLPALPLAVKVPKFWIGAGSSDRRDVDAAQELPAAGPGASAERGAGSRARWPAHHGNLASAGPATAGVDDAQARPGRAASTAVACRAQGQIPGQDRRPCSLQQPHHDSLAPRDRSLRQSFPPARALTADG